MVFPLAVSATYFHFHFCVGPLSLDMPLTRQADSLLAQRPYLRPFGPFLRYPSIAPTHGKEQRRSASDRLYRRR